MTEGKSVGGEAPSSAPYGHCTVEVLVGKWTTLDMTKGKSVGGEAPSAPYEHCTVEVLVGKWRTLDVTEGKSVEGELLMVTVLLNSC